MARESLNGGYGGAFETRERGVHGVHADACESSTQTPTLSFRTPTPCQRIPTPCQRIPTPCQRIPTASCGVAGDVPASWSSWLMSMGDDVVVLQKMKRRRRRKMSLEGPQGLPHGDALYGSPADTRTGRPDGSRCPGSPLHSKWCPWGRRCDCVRAVCTTHTLSKGHIGQFGAPCCPRVAPRRP